MENGRISPEGAGVYMTYEGFLLYRPTDVEQLLRQAPRGLTNLERRSFEIVDEKDWP